MGLVHGLGADSTAWQPLIDAMLATGGVTATTVDLRGHGESPRADSYALDELAADVAETLPAGLDLVLGHSLGGAVLVRAVAHLRPAHAVYLDPGFGLTLPTSGIGGRLFWLAPRVSLAVAALAQSRRTAAKEAAYTPAIRASLAAARARFDSSMAVDVFRDVAFHPLAVEAPVVPSTIVLSDDSPAVVPDRLATALEHRGWDVRRIAGVGHDMQLEAPERVLACLADLLGPPPR
ncbi:alpha/beta fold hydrolase [Serinibacter arcticus]|uniref:alpha/beta fold hydrolase n=1 Tax=Serinibacter arcticus TaxID=1655435 RepID=UPI001F3688AA|nr:alpha/beta fold hydrolase [Serinibacter arcticus]